MGQARFAGLYSLSDNIGTIRATKTIGISHTVWQIGSSLLDTDALLDRATRTISRYQALECSAMLVALSYPLSEKTPFYSGLERPSLHRLYDLSAGDTCNSFYFRTSNHAGTHVDGPLHFNVRGRSVMEYDANELVFTRPGIADVRLEKSELISPARLAPAIEQISRDCDILLLRSGFGAYRDEEHTYVEDAPGFSADAARYILAMLPELRALAMDFISAAAMKHMLEGCEAHRVFLGCPGYSDRTVLLVEDAFLPPDLTPPSRIMIVPWRFEGLDSAPCTLLAEY